MRHLLLILLLVWLLTPAQTFTCTTAVVHAHDKVRDAQIQVTAWTGCSLSGVIDGANVQLWADGSSCGLRDKVPGTFQIRYDVSCGQVLELSNGTLSPACPASPTPTPVASPSPTPVPTPTPLPTPVPTTDDCVLNVPASVLLSPNSNSQVTITLTSTVSRSRTITAVSDSGQVFVSPFSQSVSGISALVGFTLRPKKRGAQITFSSPCGTRTMVVAVR